MAKKTTENDLNSPNGCTTVFDHVSQGNKGYCVAAAAVVNNLYYLDKLHGHSDNPSVISDMFFNLSESGIIDLTVDELLLATTLMLEEGLSATKSSLRSTEIEPQKQQDTCCRTHTDTCNRCPEQKGSNLSVNFGNYRYNLTK